ARAVGEDLEDMAGRVIAPDAGVDRHAPGVGRAGLADARVGEDAMTAIKPAVGPPGERVERLVGVLVAPAVEQYLGRAVGPIVAVDVGDVEELRRRADPDAAEADFQPADQVELLGEDLPRVEPAIAIGILE